MKTLEDYHDLYLLTDVLLLADVFETFRKTCLRHYSLDPAHSYTAPGFAWQAALKMTGVNLDLMSDNDMYLFCEPGGVSVISQRFSERNDVAQSSRDDQAEIEKNHPIYLDVNNLYGWVMSQHMPVSGFYWVGGDEMDALMVVMKQFGNNTADAMTAGKESVIKLYDFLLY